MCREGLMRVHTHLSAPRGVRESEPNAIGGIVRFRHHHNREVIPVTPKKKLSDIVKDMTKLKQQWANTKPAPDTDKPIPPGDYVCDLIDGAAFEARTGTQGFKVTLKVREGELAGRLVWHDYYLTEKALPYTLRALAKIGITDPEQLDAGLPAGLVVKAKIIVNTRDGGGERNEVRSWELVAVNADAAPGAPTQAAGATPPGNPAPWEVDLDALDGDTPKGDGR